MPRLVPLTRLLVALWMPMVYDSGYCMVILTREVSCPICAHFPKMRHRTVNARAEYVQIHNFQNISQVNNNNQELGYYNYIVPFT